MSAEFSARHALPSAPLIVGRDREIAALREAVHRAIGGTGGLVLVSGEAGIGKTTLVQHLVTDARENSALILSGAAYDLSATPPYGPWLELTDRYQDDPELPELPVILRRDTGMGGLQSQSELFACVRDFFVEVSEVRPLVVVLEDLHWADQASLDLLRYLARHVAEHRIMLIATYRDDEVTRQHPLFQLLPALVRESQTERVELGRLQEQDIERLIEQLIELPPPDREPLANYLFRWAEGNPLFTEELLRTLEQEGMFEPDHAGERLQQLQAAKVPSLVQQMIGRRMSFLSDETYSALQSAAVIGQIVPVELWERISGARRVDAATDEALSAHIITAASPKNEVHFRHALLREAVYYSMTPSTRRELHKSIAEVYLRYTGPDRESVAYHLKQAGDPRAGEWMILAGEQAERRLAWQEAIDRLTEAADMLRAGQENDPLLAGVLLKLGRLPRFLDPNLGYDHLEESYQTALRCGEEAIAAIALSHLGNIRTSNGDTRAGLRDQQSALEMLANTRQDVEAVRRWSETPFTTHYHPFKRLAGSVATQHAHAGQFHEAISIADQYLGVDWRAARQEDRFPSILAESLTCGSDGFHSLGMALDSLGQPEEAEIAWDLAEEVVTRAGYRPARLMRDRARLTIHQYPYRTTDLTARRKYTGSLEEPGSRAEGALGRANLLWSLGYSLLYEGHWDELRRMIQEEALPTMGIIRVIALSVRARLAWNEGHWQEAQEQIDSILPNGPDLGDELHIHVFQREPHRIAAGLAIDCGDLERAREWLRAHDDWLQHSGAVLGRAEGTLLWARLHLAKDNEESAMDSAYRALGDASDPRQPMALIEVHRFLGQLFTRNEEYDAADHHLEESRRLAEASALPYDLALTRLELGELEIARGRSNIAQEHLTEARRICSDLGAEPALARAEGWLNDLRPRSMNNPAGLSHRELDVLRLLARGMSNEEIASELFIARRTVTNHVSSILRKLDVNSRAAAAAQAIHEDLV